MEVTDQVGEDKFKVNDDYDFDKCRIAQWLRAIDTLNCEADFSEFASDSVFRVLQNEVKLCNFSSRYMLSNMMKDIDKSYWEYGAARKAKKEVAKNFECGIGLEKFADIKEGDIMEAFIMEEYKD